MRVFVTGATGFVGSETVRELLASGHEVLGLARTDEAAAALASAGAASLLGSLEDLDVLRRGAEDSQSVVHLGFNPDFSRFKESCETDQLAIETIGSTIAGSERRFIVPNGLAGLVPSGHVVTEKDNVPQDYRFPRTSEQTALLLASKGVRVSVIRLAQVHNTTKQGLVTRLVQVARSKGFSAYVNGGSQRWPAVHVRDIARLFAIVLERGGEGEKYHAVAEEGVQLRNLAETIGRLLDIPVKSLTAEEAKDHFGPLSMFVSVDMPASAKATMEKMDWLPTGPALISDLQQIDLR